MVRFFSRLVRSFQNLLVLVFRPFFGARKPDRPIAPPTEPAPLPDLPKPMLEDAELEHHFMALLDQVDEGILSVAIGFIGAWITAIVINLWNR